MPAKAAIRWILKTYPNTNSLSRLEDSGSLNEIMTRKLIHIDEAGLRLKTSMEREESSSGLELISGSAELHG